MSTPTEEMEVDLDELDAKATPDRQKDPKKVPTDAIEVPEVKVEPKADTKAVVTPDQGLEKLKKQLEEEKNRAENEKNARIAAEQRAAEAIRNEAAARGETQTTQLDLVKNAIDSLTHQNDALEAKYAEALQAQDFIAAAKVQREMSTNAAKLIQLEAGKAALEKAPKPTPRVPDDPVEQFVTNMTPRSAAWIRSHRDCVTDEKKNRKMIRAHEDALDEGIAPDSDAYFGFIETRLGLAKAPSPSNGAGTEVTLEEPELSEAAKPKGSRTPPAAPVSRSGSSTGSKRSNTITLTPEQVEAAANSGLTPQEYARQVVALRGEGKLN